MGNLLCVRWQCFPNWFTNLMLTQNFQQAIFFSEIDKLTSEFIWKHKGHKIAKIFFKKKINVRGLTLLQRESRPFKEERSLFIKWYWNKCISTFKLMNWSSILHHIQILNSYRSMAWCCRKLGPKIRGRYLLFCWWRNGRQKS